MKQSQKLTSNTYRYICTISNTNNNFLRLIKIKFKYFVRYKMTFCVIGMRMTCRVFLWLYSEETKKNGLVLIVDARKGAWRVARSCIKLSTVLLGASAASVIVVRPDGFWDKRVDSCTKSHKEGEVRYLQKLE